MDQINLGPSIMTSEPPVYQAMAICTRHEYNAASRIFMDNEAVREWRAPWEACRRVYAVWRDSEAARREREYLQAEKRDLDFINSVSERLP